MLLSEGGSSAAHVLQPSEPALEDDWWMVLPDDPWHEQREACEAEVYAAARRFNRVSYALRDLPHDEYMDTVRGPYAKWSDAVAVWEACYPHRWMEMPCCVHCKYSVFHCVCVFSLPCKVCAGQQWNDCYADVPLWLPGFWVCMLAS